MPDFSNSKIFKASVHKIGKDPNGEDLIISSDEIKFQKTEEMNELLRSLTQPIEDGLNYEFSDLDENLVYNNCKEVFLNPGSFHFKSIIVVLYKQYYTIYF